MKKNVHYTLFCVGYAIAIRAIVSLHSYSGQNKPPMYGDYEAQRHWQEVCINLPASQWYKNSSDNDLQYWGLDYPPLTAAHSFLIGSVAKAVNESFVQLHKSRGESSEHHKNFMRTSVLLSDALIYIPAVVLCASRISVNHKKSSQYGVNLIHVLFYPGQILIDNGHFQYNNMSLGLALFAIVAIFNDKDVLAAVLFSMALNYKQMELYHAIPFFMYLLSRCFNAEKSRNFLDLRRLLAIGIVVVLVFFFIWFPWISSYDCFISVLKRIFPIGRGIFEDKVSNFWCVLNVLVKIRKLFSNEIMAVYSLILTVLTNLPTCIHLFLHPEKVNFLYALVNSSLSFFLFSFQVHEKSILLSSLPVLLLCPMEPFASFWFLQVSTFSMFPLFVKDGLVVAFVAMNILFYSVWRLRWHYSLKLENTARSCQFMLIYTVSTVSNIVLQFCHLFITPPTALPHIFPLAISVLCFIHFLFFFLYFNIKQLSRK